MAHNLDPHYGPMGAIPTDEPQRGRPGPRAGAVAALDADRA